MTTMATIQMTTPSLKREAKNNQKSLLAAVRKDPMAKSANSNEEGASWL